MTVSKAFANQALALAASECNIDDARKALQMGAEPNFVDSQGFTAALYFADYGCAEGVYMVFEEAQKKDAEVIGYPPSRSAQQVLQVNKHKVSAPLLFIRRGDVATVLKLAEMDPSILSQPILNELKPDLGFSKADVVSLIKAGFVTDARLSAILSTLSLSLSSILEDLEEAA